MVQFTDKMEKFIQFFTFLQKFIWNTASWNCSVLHLEIVKRCETKDFNKIFKGCETFVWADGVCWSQTHQLEVFTTRKYFTGKIWINKVTLWFSVQPFISDVILQTIYLLTSKNIFNHIQYPYLLWVVTKYTCF